MIKIFPVCFAHLTFLIILFIRIINCDQDQIDKSHKPNKFYNFKLEYSPSLSRISDQYLASRNKNKNCDKTVGSVSDLSEGDVNSAIDVANEQINRFMSNDQKYLANNPRLQNFSSFMYQVALNAQYNEFITKNLVKEKCLNIFEVNTRLSSIRLPGDQEFCDIEKEVSLLAECDPSYRFRREDGKCNNLVHTNWGSSFRCHRRLLPPNYADGVSEPRLAVDGSRLPNPRFISKMLLPDKNELDDKRTNLHMIWGQYFVHDVLKTLQYWGNALDCCNKSTGFNHDQCLPITPIPKDQLTVTYNQSCQSFVRSLGCKTCSLGYRDQLNAATSLIDLSNMYGGNENATYRVRSYKDGLLRGDSASDGSYILPRIVLPQDDDRIDLIKCNPPADRPWLGCLFTGDGMRANQQPMIMALHILWNRRHNQHANALSKINPHWDDERLYQEAKRINIAEFTKINFVEYFPTILNKQLIDYYQLSTKRDGFSDYNPDVDPTGIQSVSVAALRYGHSQIHSRYQVIKKQKTESYGIQLRNKFLDLSDIWDGNTNGILAGLSAVPARAVDPFIVSDAQDYLLFRQGAPKMRDLPATNINRGRDHGVPGYVYYVQYCTGVQIRSWMDLYQFIPGDYVKSLAKIYKDFRDIDLFVGGLAERHMNDSLVGPTFGCLLSIQIYHWKYGDRFYFEHGGQAGSFKLDQLNNIRNVSTLANVLCKTTDFDSISEWPMLLPSDKNKKIQCKSIPDLNYELWREEDSCSVYCEYVKAKSLD